MCCDERRYILERWKPANHERICMIILAIYFFNYKLMTSFDYDL